MGVLLFAFNNIFLRQRRSQLVLRQSQISRQKLSCTRQQGELARYFAQRRSQLSSVWQAQLNGQQESNISQNTLNGASGFSNNSNCTNMFNSPAYASYQAELAQLEAEQKAQEAEIAQQDQEMEMELAMVKQELALIEEEIKANEEGFKSAVKDSAPKYTGLA